MPVCPHSRLNVLAPAPAPFRGLALSHFFFYPSPSRSPSIFLSFCFALGVDGFCARIPRPFSTSYMVLFRAFSTERTSASVGLILLASHIDTYRGARSLARPPADSRLLNSAKVIEALVRKVTIFITSSSWRIFK